jgi:cytochrome c oxidase subunit 2
MRLAGKRRPVIRTFALVLIALLGLLTVNVAFAQSGQSGGITQEAHDIHRLYLFVLGLALAVFLLVESGLVYAIIKFRRKNDELPAQTHGSNVIEMIWTGIPMVIVASIFIFTFITLQRIEHKSTPENLTVEVTGFQFQWQFTYNLNDLGKGSDLADKRQVTVIGTQAEEPTLVIPIDEPVEFKLVSNDVIHSFYVRDFLYKLDVVPGRDNRFTITARELGDFTGQCAELCGLNHALMRFKVHVVQRAEFDKWVAEKAAGAKTARQP